MAASAPRIGYLWPEGDPRLALYRYWEPRVGVFLARRQAEYEFGLKVIRAHKAGASLHDIAERFHCSRARAHQIEARALRRAAGPHGGLSPVELYFEQPIFFSDHEVIQPPRIMRKQKPRKPQPPHIPEPMGPAIGWGILRRAKAGKCIDVNSIRTTRRGCMCAWLWAQGVSSLSAETELQLWQLWQDTSYNHVEAPEIVEVEVTLCERNESPRKLKR